MILENVICNLHGLSKIMFLRYLLTNPRKEQVLQVTMVLPTFAETKVGRAANDEIG
jgi:hypothetical protein